MKIRRIALFMSVRLGPNPGPAPLDHHSTH